MQLTKTLFAIVILFLNACTYQEKDTAIAVAKDIRFSFYHADSVAVLTRHGISYINNEIANGYLYKLDTQKDTLFLEGYMNGKKQGVCYAKYPNLQYKYVRRYENGKAEGIQRAWWENGQLKQEASFKNDVFHGKLREWNAAGILTRDNTHINGHENGKQRLWYDNGKLRANYIVKNGRIYGLSGTMNCFNAEEKNKKQ